jgi:hypothetical protein
MIHSQPANHRSSFRLVALSLLTLSGAGGLIFNNLLKQKALPNPSLRYPAVVVVSYLLFLLLCRIFIAWVFRILPELRAVSSESYSEFLEERAGNRHHDTSGVNPAVSKRKDVLSELFPAGVPGILAFGGPTLFGLVVLFSVVLLVLFLGWWLLFEVPLVILEVTIQYQLARKAIRAIRSVPPGEWFKTLIMKTLALLLLFLIGSSLLGMEIHRLCPDAVTGWECLHPENLGAKQFRFYACITTV